MMQCQYKHLINGQWESSETLGANINPSDLDDLVGNYAQGDQQQTINAIEAAKTAFQSWSCSPIQQRFDMLDAVGSEILARKDELAKLLAREEGKALSDALGEVIRAGQIFKFFAGECVRQTGDKLASTRQGMEVEVTREPVGVVGLITPWNFPIAIPAWKIAPALAYGNTVVFKPAELVPASAWALADIIHRAGAPAGVFNLVLGKGSIVGETLVNHLDVAAISFTGSEGTGRNIASKVVARMGKVQLEMGGKNPLVVLDDADLEVAAEVAVNGAFYATGQRCTASSRFIVTKGIHDRFVAAVVNKMGKLEVGHALDTNTKIGPVVDKKQLDNVCQYIRVGKDEGAKLAFGGEILQRKTKGFFLQPTLFTQANSSMRIAKEEIFGPVACVIKVADYEEALAVANDTVFGLSSGIVTTSLKYANHFKRHAHSGMVMVNAPTAGVDYHVPFGGRNGSSYGSREQGRYAAEFYTTVKTVYIAS
ncbi:MAG: aldehyde dehydrogenase family protein [Paraglaciecola sp.]|uniref:aldehyde dehydrogenase family protein n=1 Tax=Paraglaciecola sp. TaxID=1920173 RepID=UPI0032997D84